MGGSRRGLAAARGPFSRRQPPADRGAASSGVAAGRRPRRPACGGGTAAAGPHVGCGGGAPAQLAAAGDDLSPPQRVGEGAPDADPRGRGRRGSAAAGAAAGGRRRDLASHLDDEAHAAELYAAVVALDDTRDDLAEKLAEIRLRRGDLTGLLPLAERLAARAEGSLRRSSRASITGWGGRARPPATRMAPARPIVRRRARRGATRCGSRWPTWPPCASAARSGPTRRPRTSGSPPKPVPRRSRAKRACWSWSDWASRGCARATPQARSRRWSRRWRWSRVARMPCRRSSLPRVRSGMTTWSCATRPRCWPSPVMRRPSATCWSWSPPSITSVATTPSARSPPTSRRCRSGRMSGRSCTGCWSCCPKPSSGSRQSRSCATWPS